MSLLCPTSKMTLKQACIQGNITAVKHIVTLLVEFDVTIPWEQILVNSVESGNQMLVQYVVNENKSFFFPEKNESAPVRRACVDAETGDPHPCYEEITEQPDNIHSAIRRCVDFQHPHLLTILLGAPTRSLYEHDFNVALRYACINGKLHMVQFLCEHIVHDVLYLYQPLYDALAFQHFDVFLYLVEYYEKASSLLQLTSSITIDDYNIEWVSFLSSTCHFQNEQVIIKIFEHVTAQKKTNEHSTTTVLSEYDIFHCNMGLCRLIDEQNYPLIDLFINQMKKHNIRIATTDALITASGVPDGKIFLQMIKEGGRVDQIDYLFAKDAITLIEEGVDPKVFENCKYDKKILEDYYRRKESMIQLFYDLSFLPPSLIKHVIIPYVSFFYEVEDEDKTQQYFLQTKSWVRLYRSYRCF
jgi:hypothetical protein